MPKLNPSLVGFATVSHKMLLDVPRLTDAAKAHNTRGIRYSENGADDKAIAAFTKVIELNPNFAQVYYNRGLTYHKNGRIYKALKDYNAAIELNPVFTDAYCNRGIACIQSGDHDLAVEDLGKAMALNPRFTEAYVYRGIAYVKAAEIEAVLERYHIPSGIGQSALFGSDEPSRSDVLIKAAIEDFGTAISLTTGFQCDYKDVADFEQKTGIPLPEDIAAMLTPQKPLAEHQKETRLALALKYYESGELSTGLAARLADVPYSEFLVLIGKHGLSPFGTIDELEEDFKIARKTRTQYTPHHY